MQRHFEAGAWNQGKARRADAERANKNTQKCKFKQMEGFSYLDALVFAERGSHVAQRVHDQSQALNNAPGVVRIGANGRVAQTQQLSDATRMRNEQLCERTIQ